jgi:hypothetical protein
MIESNLIESAKRKTVKGSIATELLSLELMPEEAIRLNELFAKKKTAFTMKDVSFLFHLGRKHPKKPSVAA